MQTQCCANFVHFVCYDLKIQISTNFSIVVVVGDADKCAAAHLPPANHPTRGREVIYRNRFNFVGWINFILLLFVDDGVVRMRMGHRRRRSKCEAENIFQPFTWVCKHVHALSYKFIGSNGTELVERWRKSTDFHESLHLCRIVCARRAADINTWYGCIINEMAKMPCKNGTQIITKTNNKALRKMTQQEKDIMNSNRCDAMQCLERGRNKSENEIAHRTFVHYKLINWFCMTRLNLHFLERATEEPKKERWWFRHPISGVYNTDFNDCWEYSKVQHEQPRSDDKIVYTNC